MEWGNFPIYSNQKVMQSPQKMEMSNWVKLMISHFATDSEFPTWCFIDSCWVYLLLAECGQPTETHRTARKIKQAMYCYVWLPPIQTIQTIPPLHGLRPLWSFSDCVMVLGNLR